MNDKFQIAISGSPKGQQFRGDEVLRKYSETLYSEEFKNEKAEFVRCDIKEENGKTCFYYSYIVPNTREEEGRSGGYFAISIRSEEAYCEDMSRLYQLFDQLYKKMVEDELVSKQKQFLVSEFDKGKAESIINALKKQLTDKFAASFTLLERKLSKPNGNCTLRCHVSDNGCDFFLNDFFSCGSAILSPEIPRADVKAKQFESALKDSKQECADKETKLQNAQAKEKDLRSKISELQATEKDLRSKISELEKENDKIKGQLTASKPMPEKVDELINLLKPFGSQTRTINRQTRNTAPWNEKNIQNILLGIVVLSILIAGNVLLFRKCGTDKSPAETTEPNSITATEQGEQQLKEILLDTTLDTLKVHEEKLKYGENIKFITSDEVKVKKWGYDGFSKKSEDCTCTAEVIKPNSGDTVTISLTTAEETGEKKYKHQFIVEE